MSKEVDTRIVEMQFNNRQFEENAGVTLGTLDKLKQAVQFKGVRSGLDELNASSSKVDLSALISAVDKVSVKWSAFQSIAAGIFENIGRKAEETGQRIVNALAVDPTKQGFGEYELEIGSVQTIQASTGKDFDEIYGYLDRLNDYADKTIYSFSDMTSNIGKFTNAGVELEDAVNAIQGISNEAALSGANANEASRAMYNFAQAMSSGYVKLIDWKSIELANMATVEFKEQLIDTALELGTVERSGDKFITTTADMNGNISDAFDATSAFNDSLAHQWLTSDVLVETLARYSDETTDVGKRATEAATQVKSFTQLIDTCKEALGTGWATTFKLVIGDFEEAKELWTDVNNVLSGMIGTMSDYRNEALKVWREEGGREKLLESLSNIWEGLSARVSAFSTNTHISGKTLLNLTDSFFEFSKKVRDNGKAFKEALQKTDTAKNLFATLRNVVEGATLIFRKLGKVLKAIGQAFFEVFFADQATGLKDMTDQILTFIKSFVIAGKRSDYLKRTFKGLFAIIDIGAHVIKTLVGWFAPLASSAAKGEPSILKTTASIGDFLVSLDETIKKENLVEKAIQKVTDIFNKVKSAVKNGIEAFKEFSGIDVGEKFKRLGDWIKKILENIKNLDFKGAFKTILDGIKNFASDVKEYFASIGEDDDGKGLGDLKVVKDLQKVPDKLTKIKDKIKGVISKIGDAFGSVGETMKNAFIAIGNTLSPIFDLILEIFNTTASFVKTIGTVFDFITVLFQEVTDDLNDTNYSVIKTFFSTLFGFITSLLEEMSKHPISSVLLAVILKMFLDLSSSIGGIAGGIAKFLKGTGELESELAKGIKSFRMNNLSVMIKQLAEALFVLSAAIAVIAVVDYNTDMVGDALLTLAIALGGIVGILLGLLKESNKFKNGNNELNKVALSIILMGFAMDLVAKAIARTAKATPDANILMTSAGALMAVLLLFIGLIKVVSNSKLNPEVLGSIAGVLVTLGVGLKSVAKAIKVVASSDSENLWPAIIAIWGILAIFTGFIAAAEALSSRTNPVTLMAAAAGMVALGMALKLVAEALVSVSVLNTDEMVRSGLTLGIMITVLAGILAGLTYLTGGGVGAVLVAAAILIIGAALVVFADALNKMASVDWEKLDAGLITLLKVLGIFALAGLAAPVFILLAAAALVLGVALLPLALAISMIANSIAKLLKWTTKLMQTWPKAKKYAGQLIDTLTNIVGAMIETVGDNIILVAKKVQEGAPEIGKAVEAIFSAIVNTITDNQITLADAFVGMVDAILDILAEHIGPIADNLYYIVDTILTKFEEYAPELAVKIGSIGVNLVLGFLQALVDESRAIAEKIFNLFISIVDAVASLFDDEHVEKAETSIGNLVDNLVDAVLSGVKSAKDKILSIGKKIKNYVWNGIKSIPIIGKIAQWAEDNIITPIKDKWEEIKAAGEYLVDGFLDGILRKTPDITDVVGQHTDEIMAMFNKGLDINSPSKATEESGEFFDLGFIEGIENKSGEIKDTISEIGDDISKTFTNSLGETDLSSLKFEDMGFDSEPIVSPVLDMDSLGSDFGDMTDIFGKDYSMNGLFNMEGTDQLSNIEDVFGSGSVAIAQQTSSTITAVQSDEEKSMFRELETLIRDLNSTLDDVMIIPQSSSLDITTAIDGNAVGETLVPILDVINGSRQAAVKASTAVSTAISRKTGRSYSATANAAATRMADSMARSKIRH